jgi:hypothetical protein
MYDTAFLYILILLGVAVVLVAAFPIAPAGGARLPGGQPARRAVGPADSDHESFCEFGGSRCSPSVSNFRCRSSWP